MDVMVVAVGGKMDKMLNRGIVIEELKSIEQRLRSLGLTIPLDEPQPRSLLFSAAMHVEEATTWLKR